MNAPPIHEARPDCLMLSPLQFPVRVWTADGTQAATAWTGKEWCAASRLDRLRKFLRECLRFWAIVAAFLTKAGTIHRSNTLLWATAKFTIDFRHILSSPNVI